MIGFVIAIHVIACIALIIIVLIQSGRGGGLVENLSSLESMFGTKTNTFLTRSTTVLSIIFFITCLSLALLSIRQSRSLMQNIKPRPQAASEKVEEKDRKEAPKTEKEAVKKESAKAAEAKPKEQPKAEPAKQEPSQEKSKAE